MCTAESTCSIAPGLRKAPTQPNLQQVHLIHAGLFGELAARCFKVPPGQRGKNITTRDLDLLALPVDSWLHIGESAMVKPTGLRNPCEEPSRFRAGPAAAVLGRMPDEASVRKAGVMDCGDGCGERCGDHQRRRAGWQFNQCPFACAAVPCARAGLTFRQLAVLHRNL